MGKMRTDTGNQLLKKHLKERNIMIDAKTGMVFDDYTDNEQDETETETAYWTQLCEEHAVHGEASLEEMPGDGCICGVKGCQNPAEYYYNFNEKEN